MKMNLYVKILVVILLASCQRTEFQSNSSVLSSSSNETLLDFEKVHIGDEKSLEFVVSNSTKFPVTPTGIKFQEGAPLSLENNFFPGGEVLKSNGPAVVRIENINCPYLLKPNQNCKVEIIFKPQEVKKYEFNFGLSFKAENRFTQMKPLKIFGEGIHDETLSILSPLEGSFINSVTASSVVVSGTCNSEGSAITVEPTSQKSRCVDGIYTATLNLLSQLDGNTTITVEMNTDHIPVVRSVTVIKDTLAPKIAITNPKQGAYVTPSNQNSFPISGTCDLEGATVSLNPTSATTTCTGGAFTKNLNLSTQAEGNITITAGIKDPAGNSSSSSVTVIKDTIVPKIAITSPTDGSYVNSSNQSSYTVSGTCDVKGATVSFNPTSATTICTGSSFSKNLNLSSQPEGSLTIFASIKDLVGNNSSTFVTVIKDTLAPKIAITNPKSGAYVTPANQSSYTVSGTCDLNGATVFLNPTSAVTTCTNGAFSKSLNLSTQPEGDLKITATIKDTAGNSSSSSVTVIKDTIAPKIAITNPAKGSYVNSSNQSSYTVSGTCDVKGATVSLNPTSATTTCTGSSFSTNLNLSAQAEGSLTISASIKDPVGNSSSTSVTVIKDTITPKITITNPKSGDYVTPSNRSSYTVSGTCDLNGAAISFNPTSASTTCTNSTFSKNLNLYSQSDGNLTITATIKDTAGNSSSSSVTVKKDTTGPQVTLRSASPSKVGKTSPVNFPVTYTDAKSVYLTSSKITLSGNTTQCTVSVLNGTTKTPTVKLSGCSSSSGQVTVQIQKGTAQDSLGNLALASNTRSVTVQNSGTGSGGTGSGGTGSGGTGSGGTGSGEPFIAVYKISSSNMSLDLPLKPGFSYNFTVDWGDGTSVKTVTSSSDPDKNHTYATTGTYTVTIRGLMEAYGSDRGSTPYKTQILSVSNLGDVGWKDLSFAFYDADNLTTVRGGDTSKVTNMASMFYDADQANPNTSGWDTSNVTNMSYMFARTDQAYPNVSKWNTSKVTTMKSMFFDATRADPDVRSWNTSRVTTMANMFLRAARANPDVRNWNTSNVTNMDSMFSSAYQANPDVSSWNTSNVTYIGQMFLDTPKANPNISGWSFASLRSETAYRYNAVDRFLSSNYSNLTTTNYSNFLIKLASYEVTSSCEPSPSFCSLYVGNVKYNSSARSARTTLINGGWNITDGGQQ